MRIRKSNTNCKGGDRREARAMAMAVVFPTRWPSLARRLFSFAIPTLRTHSTARQRFNPNSN